jgi:hypothetical protein
MTRRLAIVAAVVVGVLGLASPADAHWQVRARYCNWWSAHCHVLHR